MNIRATQPQFSGMFNRAKRLGKAKVSSTEKSSVQKASNKALKAGAALTVLSPLPVITLPMGLGVMGLGAVGKFLSRNK